MSFGLRYEITPEKKKETSVQYPNYHLEHPSPFCTQRSGGAISKTMLLQGGRSDLVVSCFEDSHPNPGEVVVITGNWPFK